MVRGSICYKRVLEKVGAVCIMNDFYYTRILDEVPLPVTNDSFGDVWTLQLDNAWINTAAQTKNRLDAHDVNVLRLFAVSPSLNIIKNVRSLFVRLFYKDGATYDTVEQLADTIFECVHTIDFSFIQNLYKSIPRRCVAVIEKIDISIDYWMLRICWESWLSSYTCGQGRIKLPRQDNARGIVRNVFRVGDCSVTYCR